MQAEFILHGEFIELYKLLKAEGFASTGGEAKAMIAEGTIRVNGEVETRKRNKLRAGDIVEVGETRINILATSQ